MGVTNRIEADHQDLSEARSELVNAIRVCAGWVKESSLDNAAIAAVAAYNLALAWDKLVPAIER